jgi:translocation and assembly module TamB
MKKATKWILGVVLFLVVLVVAAALIYNSRAFHNFVLAKIIETAETSTGGKVEVSNYNFSLRSLRGDLYGVVLHGTEPATTSPLFSADRISVGLKILSAFHRKVDLREIIIDHPVVHLVVDKQGRNNIPTPKQKSSSSTNIFDLAIKHAVLNRGEIYYNDDKSMLDADVRDLQAEAKYRLTEPVYDGTLSYHQGRVNLSNYRPLTHNLSVSFAAAQDNFQINQLEVTTTASRISVAGAVNNFSNPTADAKFQASLSTEDVASITGAPPPATGIITADGTIRYRNEQNRPFIELIYAEGTINSPNLLVRSGQTTTTIRAFRGHYRLEDGNLTADGIQADLLGGRVLANASIKDLGARSDTRLQLALQNISLAAASKTAGSNSFSGVPVQATVNGTANATWRGSMQGLRVKSDLAIRGNTTASRPATAVQPVSAIPIDGEIHLTYDDARKLVSFQNSSIRTPHTNVQLNGTTSKQSALAVKVTSDDLHELDLLALTLRRSAPVKPKPGMPAPEPPQLLGIYGSATLIGTVRGALDQPHFTGQATLNGLQYQNTRIETVRTDVDLSPSGAALHNGVLRAASASSLRFDLSVGLRNWSYSETSPINVQVSSNQMPLADIERVANKQLPATGTVTVNISLQGSQLHPSGQGTIRLANARVNGQPIQNASIDFHGTGDSVISKLTVQAPPGRLTADLTLYPATKAYEVQFNAPNVQLAQIDAVRARNLPIAGALTISGSGKGTFEQPQIDVTAQVPQLQVPGRTISGLQSRINVANQRADISLIASVPEGDMRASATVNLTGEYETTAKVDTRSLPLGAILATYVGSGAADQFRGETEIHATLNGPLKNATAVQAHIELPILTLGYQSLELGSVRPIRIDYRNGVATLQPAEFRGTNTDLKVQGSVPVVGAGSFNANATGLVDLGIVKMFSPDIETGGKINLDVVARGDRARPNIGGEIRIIDAAFHTPAAPLGIDHLNGTLAVRNDRIEVTSLTGESGGGSIRGTGSVTFLPAVRFNLAFDADNVRLRYPRGVRAMLASRIALTGGMESAALSGTVTVNRVSFTNEFDLSSFMDQFSGASVITPDEGFAQKVRLDIAIHATEAAELQSSKLSLDGSANLRVVGNAAESVILGRADLTSGELFMMSNRYQIQRGTIDFVNPVRTEPVLNLAVTTTIDQYKINLNLAGPMERLRTSYTSDPPLPPVDIINLLAFGNTTEQPGQTTPGSLGAQSVLAKGLSGQVSSKVEKLAGISHLSIDPLLGGNNKNPGARVAIQQRVTKDIFFTFATDVTSTQNDIVQLEYQVTPTWSVTATREENGGYGITFKKRKSF